MAMVKLPHNKRRKLSTSPKLPSMPSPPMIFSHPSANPKNAALTCSSCHRHAQNASRSFIVFCARCGSPTCTICSRTCSASTPSATHLNWGPSTNTGPNSNPLRQPQSQSLQRFALTLNSANTNTAGYANAFGKRKKSKDDDSLSERDCAIRLEHVNESGEAELGGSCGRTVCKSCCFESNLNDNVTCYDCYGGC
ncbi:hypothetical protein C8J55DRAFT_518886 [Lentinula edodes]|uniref:B box-type domain-containing protein n=1 Tax=Lentinula lateritia TaxID=40482 RepID=A0A9W9A4J5_9AGAR|nr:hypothetical protein C8J55DRAFT_518886 [Lentinula edodes]